jgi:hypothetical protein
MIIAIPERVICGMVGILSGRSKNTLAAAKIKRSDKEQL